MKRARSIEDANVRFVDLDGGELGCPLTTTAAEDVVAEIYGGVAALMRAPNLLGPGAVRPTYSIGVGWKGSSEEALEATLYRCPLPPGVELFVLPGGTQRIFPLYGAEGGLAASRVFYLLRRS